MNGKPRWKTSWNKSRNLKLNLAWTVAWKQACSKCHYLDCQCLSLGPFWELQPKAEEGIRLEKAAKDEAKRLHEKEAKAVAKAAAATTQLHEKEAKAVAKAAAMVLTSEELTQA
jgi:hypothetical protein